MDRVLFSWDPGKDRLNQRKHGVGFDEASSVFEDDDALLIADPDHSIGEERFVLLGFSRRSRVLVVVHCEQEEDGGRLGDGATVIRIISARRADRSERAAYAAGRRL